MGAELSSRHATSVCPLSVEVRQVLDRAPEALLLVGDDGRILLASRQVEVTFGYSADELTGQPVEMLVPHAVRRQHIMKRTAYFARGGPQRMTTRAEVRGLTKGGTEVPVEVSINTAQLGNKTVAICIVHDISLHKQEQTALERAKRLLNARRESERRRLQQVIDVLPEGLLIADDSGCLLGNAATTRILGVDLTGMHMATGEDRPFDARGTNGVPYSASDLPLLRSVNEGEIVVGEQVTFRNAKTGRDTPLLLNSAPLLDDDGDIAGGVVAFQDISKLKAIEQQKDELLATLTHILDGMAEAVVALDAEGRIVRANHAACQLFGRSPAAMLGQVAYAVFRWEDEAGRSLEKEEYGFAAELARGTPRTITGRYFRKPDGRRIPVSISSAPVNNVQPGVRMVVQVIRDVSREREVEELKDRIISLVSHELRTPITHIKGFASSLLEPDVTWDLTTLHEFHSEIDKEADRLSILVTDLLDMSKIESGRDFLDKRWCKPADVVRQALAAVQSVTCSHRVVNEVSHSLPVVFADSSQLERVFTNLVENAAKYSEGGTEIRVSVECADEELRFCVADQGPGIAPEYRERIFERFFRIKTGRSRAPGTGLGLPICRGIVEAHGGRLWLETEEGQGSRFYFSLPVETGR